MAQPCVKTIFFLNGREIEPGAPALLADDRGFTLGDGLFETLRGYGGVPFQLQAHLARIQRSARRIGIEAPAELADQVLAALEAFRRAPRRGAADAAISDCAIRITISAGGGDRPGLLRSGVGTATTVVMVQEFRPAVEWYRRGVRVVTAEGRLNEFSPTAGLKRLGYLDSIVTLERAREQGADDAIWLDTRGHLAEATASNLFLVTEDDLLLTPPQGCGILPGLTREAVLELAPRLGLAAREQELRPEHLTGAAEAFLTNSLREIVPVCAFDGVALGSGRPGPVTERLLAAYRARVAESTGHPAHRL
jgi:branched-chain amino acid aminotransferase